MEERPHASLTARRAPSRPSPDDLRAMQRTAPAIPQGFLTHPPEELRLRRRALSAALESRLREIEELAHWGRPREDGPDCRGYVTGIPSQQWLANRLNLSRTTCRDTLRALVAGGFVAWLVRPSRSRAGVLACLRYPERKPAKLAAAKVCRESVGITTPSAPARIRNAPASETETQTGVSHSVGDSGVSPSVGASKNHEASRGDSIAKAQEPRRQQLARKAHPRRAPAAVLCDVHPSELSDPEALRSRLDELRQAGVCSGTDRDLLQLASIAQHALRVGADPPAMFAAAVRAGRDHASDQDEDAARVLLRGRRNEPPAWQKTLSMLAERERDRSSAPTKRGAAEVAVLPSAPPAPDPVPVRAAPEPPAPDPSPLRLDELRARRRHLLRIAEQWPDQAERFRQRAAEIAQRIIDEGGEL